MAIIESYAIPYASWQVHTYHVTCIFYAYYVRIVQHIINGRNNLHSSLRQKSTVRRQGSFELPSKLLRAPVQNISSIDGYL